MEWNAGREAGDRSAGREAGDRSTSTCPAGFAVDVARVRDLTSQLGAVPEGARVLSRVPSPAPAVCFGPAPVSVITTQRVVLFDASLTGPEAAARLGHLFHHAAEGLPMEHPAPGDCAAQVDLALAAEARALALELRLRRALGAPAGSAREIPYAFEDAFSSAPAEEREPLVLAYLRGHPDGGPGLDGLASGYARRCAEAR